jgi:hypothetical protein
MPNVVGSPVKTVATQLAASGLPSPTVLEQIDPSASDGDVLSQTPAAGTARPGAIALVVARTPVVRYLADLSAVNDDPDSGTRNIAGRSYPHSIYFSTSGCDRSHTYEYNLGKHYRQADATFGLADSSADSGGKVLLEAFLDDHPVFTTTVGLNQAVPIRLNAQNVLRLKLRATYVGRSGGGCLEDTAVLGGARLLAVPSEIRTPDPSPS